MPTAEQQTLNELEESLTGDLESSRAEAMAIAGQILNRNLSIHQFHAQIGSFNNTLVDAVRSQFADPQDFFARWLHGLRVQVSADLIKEKQNPSGGKFSRSSFKLARLMQHRLVRDYTETFLVRNFYRNLVARTRAKPKDRLWSIWFGQNQKAWGLIIAPAFREGCWMNDKSEMRRAKYDYWTIGHVLETGFVDPDSNEQVKFADGESLSQFYLSVLRRDSISQYDRKIGELYVDYLRTSKRIEVEPFLIPELRYAGLESKHEYRLDFTVLNSHTMTLTGFEFSPHSTHLAVKGTKSKTQKEINSEVSKSWDNEMAKRNRYFAEFGITTITFSDETLPDARECFHVIRKHLTARPAETISMEREIQAIESLRIP